MTDVSIALDTFSFKLPNSAAVPSTSRQEKFSVDARFPTQDSCFKKSKNGEKKRRPLIIDGHNVGWQ